MNTQIKHEQSPAEVASKRSRRASPALDQAFVSLAGSAVRRYARGAEIFGEGEPANFVYRVVEGTVRIYHLLSDGRRQICDFLHAGDVLGPEAGLLHRNTAEAVGDVVLQVVPRKALAEMAATDVELTGDLWRLTMDWFQRSQDHALILARQGATERVVGFLLSCSDQIGGGSDLDLPMTRQDIADYLGLTIHTVSRTFSQLQSEGRIQLASLRQVRLCDVDDLRETNG